MLATNISLLSLKIIAVLTRLNRYRFVILKHCLSPLLPTCSCTYFAPPPALLLGQNRQALCAHMRVHVTLICLTNLEQETRKEEDSDELIQSPLLMLAGLTGWCGDICSVGETPSSLTCAMHTGTPIYVLAMSLDRNRTSPKRLRLMYSWCVLRLPASDSKLLQHIFAQSFSPNKHHVHAAHAHAAYLHALLPSCLYLCAHRLYAAFLRPRHAL